MTMKTRSHRSRAHIEPGDPLAGEVQVECRDAGGLTQVGRDWDRKMIPEGLTLRLPGAFFARVRSTRTGKLGRPRLPTKNAYWHTVSQGGRPRMIRTPLANSFRSNLSVLAKRAGFDARAPLFSEALLQKASGPARTAHVSLEIYVCTPSRQKGYPKIDTDAVIMPVKDAATAAGIWWDDCVCGQIRSTRDWGEEPRLVLHFRIRQ